MSNGKVRGGILMGRLKEILVTKYRREKLGRLRGYDTYNVVY